MFKEGKLWLKNNAKTIELESGHSASSELKPLAKADYPVKFSFMMSAPLILGAVFLKGMDVIYNPAININWLSLTAGLLAAFASGLLAIKLLSYIATRKNFSGLQILGRALAI